MDSAAPPTVRAWGTMREVLRQGLTEARVTPSLEVGPTTIGVGALEGLAGEITVIDGAVLCATAREDRAAPTSDEIGIEVHTGTPADRASLLVLADVTDWQTVELGPIEDYDALEEAVARELTARGFDPGQPTPIRLRGHAERLHLHVIRGACPIADPPTADPPGPEPRRHEGRDTPAELVGIHVTGGAGTWTHHGRSTHLHAVVDGVTGHLDDLTLTTAVLSLPRCGPPAPRKEAPE